MVDTCYSGQVFYKIDLCYRNRHTVAVHDSNPDFHSYNDNFIYSISEIIYSTYI